jgi:hypothetical protein
LGGENHRACKALLQQSDRFAGADRVRDLFLNKTIALAKRSYANKKVL